VLFKGTSSTVTCQLILKTSGEVVIQYKSVATPGACTVGLQNGTRAQGLQVAFNQAYIQNNFAIRFIPLPWLGLSANAGLTPRTNADLVNLTLSPASLAPGSYSANLLVNTADQSLPQTVFPITLTIPNPLTPLEQWRFINFGTTANAGTASDLADPDGDSLLNIFEYAFSTNPTNSNPSPVSTTFTNGHLTLTFDRAHPPPPDITWLFEVTDDLLSSNWQSGPFDVSQNVIDNGNGTETVVVTDLAPPDAPTHFLRTRLIY